MATVIAENTNTGNIVGIGTSGAYNHAISQSFNSGPSPSILYSIIVKLRRLIGNVNVTVALYAHSGTFGSSSVPTGSALISKTIPYTSVPTTEADLEFIFDTEYELDANTNYVFVVTPDDNYINLRYNTAGGDGNLGKYYESWSAVSGEDLYFKVYADVQESGSSKFFQLF